MKHEEEKEYATAAKVYRCDRRIVGVKHAPTLFKKLVKDANAFLKTNKFAPDGRNVTNGTYPGQRPEEAEQAESVRVVLVGHTSKLDKVAGTGYGNPIRFSTKRHPDPQFDNRTDRPNVRYGSRLDVLLPRPETDRIEFWEWRIAKEEAALAEEFRYFDAHPIQFKDKPVLLHSPKDDRDLARQLRRAMKRVGRKFSGALPAPATDADLVMRDRLARACERLDKLGVARCTLARLRAGGTKPAEIAAEWANLVGAPAQARTRRRRKAAKA